MTTITVNPPLVITPRLMVGARIGAAWISIRDNGRNKDGRTCYSCFIDLPDGTEHEVTDLRSGCQGGSEREGIASLCSFLSAAAESYGNRLRTGRQSENEYLFPLAVVQWAAENEDEITMLSYELENEDAND